ncbi:Xylulose kinase [Paraburkholderia solisilvae]|uniref:Xylulose kinase n=1 Tax=Paraburkholderia solisilvae TaxID=624376 RepID=A0A6J5DRK5_9BURK|nr:Xylulose kinase [Paraburkholderia solisilvae]
MRGRNRSRIRWRRVWGPLLRWVALHEPRSVESARWALQPKDWLRVALGGAVATDPSDACATALAGPDGVWDVALLERLGLPREWFAALASSSAVNGVLSADAARALGLRAGIPLATGAADTPCAALGSGLVRDGDALLTTGSGGQIVVMSTDEPAPAQGLHRYRAATGHWYRMAAMQNVGVALEAVRGWLSYEWRDAYRDAFAAGADAEAGALTFLPYLTGERTPWLNPAARGGWLGLALGASRGALMRSAFEGVAFALRAGLDAIRQSGATVDALRLAGGGSVDTRWRQLLADALDVELHAVDCPNAAARGAALLGGLATGRWQAHDLASLAPAATRVAGPGGDRAIAARYARFIDLYGRVEPWF